MALESNLKDFALADMFRLLANGKKSGTLHLENPPAQGKVCFDKGSIFFASSNWNRASLGERLVNARVVSDKQLRQALGLQKIQRKEKAGRRLGQILVVEGYLEQSVLETFVRNQINDTLFDLLRWEEGALRFEPEDLCAEEDIGVSLSVENAILEASRRLEQWDVIREKVPLTGACFSMAPAPEDRTVDIRLQPEEWMLLRSLHRGRTVSELIERVGVSEFEVARILYGMLAAGLVDMVTEEAAVPALVGS